MQEPDRNSNTTTGNTTTNEVATTRHTSGPQTPAMDMPQHWLTVNGREFRSSLTQPQPLQADMLDRNASFPNMLCNAVAVARRARPEVDIAVQTPADSVISTHSATADLQDTFNTFLIQAVTHHAAREHALQMRVEILLGEGMTGWRAALADMQLGRQKCVYVTCGVSPTTPSVNTRELETRLQSAIELCPRDRVVHCGIQASVGPAEAVINPLVYWLAVPYLDEEPTEAASAPQASHEDWAGQGQSARAAADLRGTAHTTNEDAGGILLTRSLSSEADADDHQSAFRRAMDADRDAHRALRRTLQEILPAASTRAALNDSPTCLPRSPYFDPQEAERFGTAAAFPVYAKKISRKSLLTAISNLPSAHNSETSTPRTDWRATLSKSDSSQSCAAPLRDSSGGGIADPAEREHMENVPAGRRVPFLRISSTGDLQDETSPRSTCSSITATSARSTMASAPPSARHAGAYPSLNSGGGRKQPPELSSGGLHSGDSLFALPLSARAGGSQGLHPPLARSSSATEATLACEPEAGHSVTAGKTTQEAVVTEGPRSLEGCGKSSEGTSKGSQGHSDKSASTEQTLSSTEEPDAQLASWGAGTQDTIHTTRK
jgi:hypothetical protein